MFRDPPTPRGVAADCCPWLATDLRDGDERESVGASGWDYRVPFAGSVQESLIATQRQVLSSGEYIWPWENIDPDDIDEADDVAARPTTLAELTEAKRIEDFWDEGTHSILDVERVWTEGDETDFACVRPLAVAELVQVFGSQYPSAADFDRVYQPGPSGLLEDLMGQKWSGRSMVIYSDEIPTEVYFWGWSGD